jgi:hypothetical protein
MSLNFLAKSVQAEIHGFLDYVQFTESDISKQAFLEARRKLKVEAFSTLFNETAALAANDASLKRWHELLVDAIDGSTLQLENTQLLREQFGVCGGPTGVATAQISTLTDVLNNNIVIDAQIAKYGTSERELAYRHHERLVELGTPEQHVIIYDRGYMSEAMLIDLTKKHINYVFRVKRRQYIQLDKITTQDARIYLKIGTNKYRVRVVKVKLSTGETETLVTNLAMNKYPYGWMKELYNLRWGIETGYDTLKNKLQIESFTGTSALLVEQDFYAALLLKNMVAFAKLESDERISTDEATKANNGNPNKYHYRTNENQLISVLKDKLILAILEPDPVTRDLRVTQIIMKACRLKVPIRKGRQYSRQAKHPAQFSNSKKRVL